MFFVFFFLIAHRRRSARDPQLSKTMADLSLEQCKPPSCLVLTGRLAGVGTHPPMELRPAEKEDMPKTRVVFVTLNGRRCQRWSVQLKMQQQDELTLVQSPRWCHFNTADGWKDRWRYKFVLVCCWMRWQHRCDDQLHPAWNPENSRVCLPVTHCCKSNSTDLPLPDIIRTYIQSGW